MTQSVINDGMQIFDALQEALHKANNEILVVAAWFTDSELLDTLVKKCNEGLKVTVIISQNRDNEKLDFKKVSRAGGKVVWVKPKGYGILHNKFCIIDKKLVFHGSYNWTVNAKKNNSESVIKSDHQPTIDALLSEFEGLMQKNLGSNSSTLSNSSNNIAKNLISRLLKRSNQEERSDNIIERDQEDNLKKEIKTDTSDIDEIFKSIISAELKKTNREEIKDRAYNQAKEVSGDAEVIEKSMDSLYHLFISDKTENTEKKNRLLQKIDKKVEDLSQGIITQKDERNHSLEIENQSIQKDLEIQKNTFEGEQKAFKNQIDFIQNTTIKDFEKSIDKEKVAIKEWEVAYVKPRWKWHEFIPLLIILIGLLVAMFLFYSSSAYIMLYSLEDAKFQLANGLEANPQVFQAKAIGRAFDKNFIAGVYILAFVFIPLAIAYTTHFGNEKKSDLVNNGLNSVWKRIGLGFKNYSGYIFIVILDVFIAYKVADTINEIKYLTQGLRSSEKVYTDVNFWLVFCLGAVPFFFLASILEKFLVFLGTRNVQAGKEKMLIMKKHALKTIEDLEGKIMDQKKEIHGLEDKIQKLEIKLQEIQHQITYLPRELDSKIKENNENTFNHLQLVLKKADLYKNDIENDNIQISMSSLKDRVSAFIEGWSEWLHDEFAVSKAVELSKDAMNKSDAWLEANLKKIEI